MQFVLTYGKSGYSAGNLLLSWQSFAQGHQAHEEMSNSFQLRNQ
jgi:hypothetical protein